MNKFINYLADKLLELIKLITLTLKQTNNKLTTYNTQQDNMKKIYEPIIQEKKQINNDLYTNLKATKHKNKLLQEKIYSLHEENKNLQNKVNILQDIIFTHKIK